MNKKLLDPCNPCVRTGVQCEQCMFGYRSEEDNHKHMKELILAVNKGEKPIGWKAAELYMHLHNDWEERMNDSEKEEKEPKLDIYNQEHYIDSTAYFGIKNAEPEDREGWLDPDEWKELKDRHYKLLGCIFRICELSGFTVENRIELRDNKTGRVWR